MLIAPFRSLTGVVLAAAVACGSGLATMTAQAKSADPDPALAGEILLRLRSASALGPILTKYQLEEIGQFGRRPIYRTVVSGAASVEETLDALELEFDVLAAEANSTAQSPEARRNAAWAIGQESDYAAQWAPEAVRLEAAHQLSTGEGTRVAVLDTGVDATHPGLAGRLLPGWDFVDADNDPSEVGTALNPGYGHGTHVTGLIALAAPDARIIPARVLDADGMGNVWVLAEALIYAVDPDQNPATDDGAHVVNLSVGTVNRSKILRTVVGLATCAIVTEAALVTGPFLDPDIDLTDPGYDNDKDRCDNFRGAVVVAAAGNDGTKSVRQYPAGAGVYGMLSVGASDASGSIASFSNYGSWVDIAAPGSEVTSFVPGGGYGTWSGTSMAAPLVTGTAALLISRHPTMPPRTVTRNIERSGSRLCGSKLRQVDAAAAFGDADLDNCI